MEKDHPNVAFFPPLGAGVTLILIWLTSTFLPLAARGGTAWSIAPLGYVLIAIGGVFGASAILYFVRAGTHVEPHKPTLAVVRGGPYRVTRNPMYLGLVCVVLGLSFVLLDVLWGVVWTAVFALALHFGVILREEAYLEDKFGDDYRALLDQTRRWL